jgi:hypothetical protein
MATPATAKCAKTQHAWPAVVSLPLPRYIYTLSSLVLSSAAYGSAIEATRPRIMQRYLASVLEERKSVMQCSWLCSAFLKAETYMKYRTSRKRTAANLNFPGRLADGALRKLLVAGFALAALANVTLAQESKRDAFAGWARSTRLRQSSIPTKACWTKPWHPKLHEVCRALAAGDAPNGKRPVW